MDAYIKKLIRGDEKAFEQLVGETQNKIYAVCLNMLKNTHDAQDAAQETFIKAYRSLTSFKGESKVETWLTKIAVNTCLDILRKRREMYDLDEAADAADVNTPESKAEKNETRQMVRSAINTLPPEMRSIVVLKDIEGYSYEEIADMLNLNIGTVRSRLSRAREKLRKIFMENRELF